jgi:hypothetical protein
MAASRRAEPLVARAVAKAGSLARAAAMAWFRVKTGAGAVAGAGCDAWGRDWAVAQAQRSAKQPRRAASLEEAQDRNMAAG